MKINKIENHQNFGQLKLSSVAKSALQQENIYVRATFDNIENMSRTNNVAHVLVDFVNGAYKFFVEKTGGQKLESPFSVYGKRNAVEIVDKNTQRINCEVADYAVDSYVRDIQNGLCQIKDYTNVHTQGKKATYQAGTLLEWALAKANRVAEAIREDHSIKSKAKMC